jgi:hypothetical protein
MYDAVDGGVGDVPRVTTVMNVVWVTSSSSVFPVSFLFSSSAASLLLAAAVLPGVRSFPVLQSSVSCCELDLLTDLPLYPRPDSPKKLGDFSLPGLRIMLDPHLEELPNRRDDGVWTGVVAGVDAVEEDASGAESLLVERL